MAQRPNIPGQVSLLVLIYHCKRKGYIFISIVGICMLWIYFPYGMLESKLWTSIRISNSFDLMHIQFETVNYRWIWGKLLDSSSYTQGKKEGECVNTSFDLNFICCMWTVELFLVILSWFYTWMNLLNLYPYAVTFTKTRIRSI
jgi:hypothetical protein